MLIHFCNLFIPLIVTNTLHMLVVKYELLSSLKIPISKKNFGKNKTLRGVLFISLINACISHILIQEGGFLNIGFMTGFAYALMELPNSFVKRKMGIAEGEKSERHKILFTILDKSDSSLGVCLIYSLLQNLTLHEFIILFLSAFVTHLCLSQLLVNLKIKKSL